MKIMTQNNFNFDPLKDIQEVDQFGYVDLRKAFENGYVPGDLESDDSSYNDIEDPASIVGRPHDAFEAMRMQDSIVEKVNSSSAKANVNSSESNSEN